MKIITAVTENKWYVEIYSWMMRIFIVLTFFFPMYHSDFKKHVYYMEFLWPYLFLLLSMGMLILRHCRDKWKHRSFARLQLILLIVYVAVSVYAGKAYQNWMWESIHNTVAFSFMILFIIYPGWTEDLDFDLIRFLLQCVTLSMFCAIVYYCLGYAGLQLHNGIIDMTRVEDMVVKYGEKRMSWIYYHKSQFAIMQLVFLGFSHRYRYKFKTLFHYGFAQMIFLICLILSHSWTALAAAVLIVGGILLDQLISITKQKKIQFRWRYLGVAALALAAVGTGGFLVLSKMSQERNLLTLGSRIPIWRAGIRFILENPQGVGKKFGKNIIDCGLFLTNNCHNVFLNAMMRYSVPVGMVFSAILLAFFIYLLWRRKTFFGAGYIAALFMMLCIDYALLSYGVASFLLLVYLTMEPEVEHGTDLLGKTKESKVVGSSAHM